MRQQCTEIKQAKEFVKKRSGEKIIDLKPCEDECAEMYKKGELKQGVNIEGCIKALCDN